MDKNKFRLKLRLWLLFGRFLKIIDPVLSEYLNQLVVKANFYIFEEDILPENIDELNIQDVFELNQVFQELRRLIDEAEKLSYYIDPEMPKNFFKSAERLLDLNWQMFCLNIIKLIYLLHIETAKNKYQQARMFLEQLLV